MSSVFFVFIFHVEIQTTNHFFSPEFWLLWFFQEQKLIKRSHIFWDSVREIRTMFDRICQEVDLWRNRQPPSIETWRWMIRRAQFFGSSMNAISTRCNQLDKVHRNWTKFGFVLLDLKTLVMSNNLLKHLEFRKLYNSKLTT